MNRIELERVKPHQAGVAAEGIDRFLDLVADKQINLHSFMLLRHGKVAAEGYFRPFDGRMLHNIYSVSKSVTSAAIGIAIGEGLLSLEDHIVDFFPEKLEGGGAVHPYTARMKVKHLLAMATVHPKSTDTTVDDWVKSFLTTPPTHPPGTIFAYDTTGTHTLCAIIQKLAGTSLHEYVKSRLLEPLGIGEIEWETCPMNINKGGGGIKCRTEDMARFGQLYLQKGVWNGRQVLPEGWAELSTARHIDNSNSTFLLDGKKGYGYQFWRSRHNSYCAFGMGGQFVVVIPEKDAVFVSTANTLASRDGHQLILDCLWEALYPALSDRPPQDAALEERVAQRLEKLTLILPAGTPESAASRRLAGGARYALAENPFGFEACEFVFAAEGEGEVRFHGGAGQADIRFGLNRWVTGDSFKGSPYAGGATWVDDRTLVLQIQLLSRLQMYTVTCRFDDEEVVIHYLPAGAEEKEDASCYLNGIARE
ncbi:serine hydrolase domain-containing protein [Paenibacillus hamazuiensis]|uniref:serine hydrolase domain-containing protein n=1 Tax=Paenibacillus hamazuiensis TaxID=2936508 RepID=UPI00200C2E46|nr:serine hydrolase [Paenibacillus hamazuiensis]